MFAIRRLPSTVSKSLPTAIRGNATVNVASSASEVLRLSVNESSPNPTTQGRRKHTRTKRPEISLKDPRSWNRPLPQGVIPAYDLALSLLHKDSQNLKAEVAELRKAVKEKEAQYQALQLKLGKAVAEERMALKDEMQALDQELEDMLKKLHIIEVQSEINLPDVRWTVNNAMPDMTKISHRYLLEQKWRKDGDLDLLMERIYQMNVVPDILPGINPSIDLRVAACTLPSVRRRTGKYHENVVPGVFLKPQQTRFPPSLYANVFHTDVRLYTMLLVDLDVPHPEEATYTTFLHWMKPNIPLSATSPSHIEDLPTQMPHETRWTRYIPPHPQRGTPYHRYVTLLLLQLALAPSGYTLAATSRAATEPTSVYLDIPIVQDSDRLGFDVRAFAERWNLDGAKGGGAHMWREVWDEESSKEVSLIYKMFLETEEPRYGYPPKFDPYAQMKQQKKYII